MSNRPNPVAETAVLLTQCAASQWSNKLSTWKLQAGQLADLASRLHRIAPAIQRQSEAECNGEYHQGQRDACYYWEKTAEGSSISRAFPGRVAALDAEIERVGARLDKRMEKLAAELLPLGIVLTWGGDPRGAPLTLTYDGGREYHI